MKWLYEQFMVDCTILDRRTESDGVGGVTTKWVDGAKIKAAIEKDETLSTIIADKSDAHENYFVTVNKGIGLKFHDVIRRDSDGATFRIKENQLDSETPAMATFQYGRVKAERWELE